MATFRQRIELLEAENKQQAEEITDLCMELKAAMAMVAACAALIQSEPDPIQSLQLQAVGTKLTAEVKARRELRQKLAEPAKEAP